MNWKGFFKLDKKKILIFLLIILLANIPYIGTYKGEKVPCMQLLSIPSQSVCPEDRPYSFQLNPILWPLEIVVSLDSSSLTGMIPILRFESSLTFYSSNVNLFGILIYWYILSCLIIWIYSKFLIDHSYKRTKEISQRKK